MKKKTSPIQKSPEESALSNPEVSGQAIDFINEEMEQQTIPDLPVVDLPTFPGSVYEDLPGFLQKVVARCDSNEDRDIMLLGSLVTLGSCLTKVYGRYGGIRIYPNLYLFITAQASAGKGNLVFCRKLVNPIHNTLREQAKQLKREYKIQMKQYSVLRLKEEAIEKPEKPPQKMLFIPGNNSASGIFQLLSENEGRGLIFETEADTLSYAFQSAGSTASNGLRNAYQHEMISFHRHLDQEHVEINRPCVSMLLTGTNRQVFSLIPSAENGLLSRFILYQMNTRTEWKDMFAERYVGLEDYFETLGKEFFSFYTALDKHADIEFSLSPAQHDLFIDFFVPLQKKYLRLHGLAFMGTIRRLALIAFRLAMTFTALRMLESGRLPQNLECSDADFQRVLSMIRVLIEHSGHVFSQMPGVEKQSTKALDRKEQFLDILPKKFNRQEYFKLGMSISIPEKTAEGYIGQFCKKGLIIRDKKNSYIKKQSSTRAP